MKQQSLLSETGDQKEAFERLQAGRIDPSSSFPSLGHSVNAHNRLLCSSQLPTFVMSGANTFSVSVFAQSLPAPPRFLPFSSRARTAAAMVTPWAAVAQAHNVRNPIRTITNKQIST